MRVAVLGAGALGCHFAARLACAGHPTVLVDSAVPVVEHIRAHGVRVQADDEIIDLLVPAVSDARSLEVSDVVIVLVKRPDTAAALELARGAIGPSTVVVTLQNGLGALEALRALLGADARAVGGVTYTSAVSLGPGSSVVAAGRTVLGSEAHAEAAASLARCFTDAGIPTRSVGRLDDEIWSKVALNCGGNAVAALTGLAMGALLESGALPVCEELIREAVAVARASGVPLDPLERVSAHRRLLARGGQNKSSMLQDLERGRPPEVQQINGAVAREGRRLGIPVVLNEAVAALVAARSASPIHPDGSST